MSAGMKHMRPLWVSEGTVPLFEPKDLDVPAAPSKHVNSPTASPRHRT